MRPTPSLLTLLLTCLAFSSMGQSKLKVLATASMWADMAEQIAGDYIEVDMIVPRGSDPHMYQPTPEDVIKVRDADLILKNGLTFEGWLDELIGNAGAKAKVILLTKGITPINSSTYKNSPDPHAWMSADNGVIYAKNITEALVELIPEKADSIVYQHMQYQQRLRKLHGDIMAMMLSIPAQKRVLITSHDAFQYFGQKYGLKLESVLGTSTDAQVRASDITRLSNLLKSTSIPAVFIESTVNPKQLEQLAKDHNIRIGGKLFVDALGKKDGPAGTYEGMIHHNAVTIRDGLMNDNPLPNSETNNEDPMSELTDSPWMKYGMFLLVILLLILLILRLRK